MIFLSSRRRDAHNCFTCVGGKVPLGGPRTTSNLTNQQSHAWLPMHYTAVNNFRIREENVSGRLAFPSELFVVFSTAHFPPTITHPKLARTLYIMAASARYNCISVIIIPY